LNVLISMMLLSYKFVLLCETGQVENGWCERVASEIKRERESERERQTERETDRQRDRQRECMDVNRLDWHHPSDRDYRILAWIMVALGIRTQNNEQWNVEIAIIVP